MNKEQKQQELEDYKKSLEGKTREELTEIEKAVIEDADALDKEVAETKYSLPKENFREVADAVCYFIDKQTVQWQYTLGMKNMYDFWAAKTKPAEIPYPQLDMVLRTLGGLQFTGHDEWDKVIAINTYFEPLHNAYSATTEKVYDVAAKHNAVMAALNAVTPIGDNANVAQTVKAADVAGC